MCVEREEAFSESALLFLRGDARSSVCSDELPLLFFLGEDFKSEEKPIWLYARDWDIRNA